LSGLFRPSSKVPKYRDPLHQLLDYISERTPDCDMVVVHDDDLARVDGISDNISLKNFQHGMVMELLRKSNKEIHLVSCDLSPVSSSLNTDTDTAVVNVAMLSTELQNARSEPDSDSQSQDRRSDHHETRQIPVISPLRNASRVEERSLSRLGYNISTLEILNWIPAHLNLPLMTLSQGRSQGHNNDGLDWSSRPPPHSSQRRNPPSPWPRPQNDVDGGGTSQKKNCIIPDCPYPAYYNYVDQEPTEYCGQRHELQAIAIGLVNTCVICEGRPRLTGERVCGRTCRERLAERARQIQRIYG